MTTRSEPHNRRAIHAEPEVNPGADAVWPRTRLVRGHGLGADIRGPDTTTDMDWLRTRLGVWPGHGQRLDRATASRPGYGADIPRPNREHFADAESFAGEGVRLVCVKSLQVPCAGSPP